MVKSATLRLAVITAALLCVVALAFASCGGRGHRWSGGQPEGLANPPAADSPPGGGLQSTDSALAELDALGCPESVDAALWAELKEALAAGLTTDNQLPTTRFASTPPTGEANRVNDLSIADNGDGTFTLSWHYRNLGDYDQNGTVGISDITPIAMHFGEAVPEEDVNRNSIQAVIDGSGNGRIGIEDVTPIAQRFGVNVEHYDVEGAETLEGLWNAASEVAQNASACEGRRKLEGELATTGHRYLRVVPCDAAGEAGVPSIPVLVPVPVREAPVAVLSADVLSGEIPFSVSLDPSGSYDPDGTIVAYKWDADGNGSYEEVRGAPSVLEHTYSTAGGYCATLVVEDNDSRTAAAMVYVEATDQSNRLPVAILRGRLVSFFEPTEWEEDTVVGFGPMDVDFDAQHSYDVDGDIVKYEWDWNGPTGGWNWEESALVAYHTFEQVGAQSVYVRVTDDKGATATDSVGVVVRSGVQSTNWVHTWGDDLKNEAEDVGADSQGFVYVTGQSMAPDGTTDIFTLKFTPSGSLAWARTWDLGYREYARAVVIDESNNIYVAGYCIKVTGFLQSEGVDILLLKYDPSGNLLWSRSWDASGSEYCRDAAVVGDGGVLLCGHILDYQGDRDVRFPYVIKVSSDGELTWAKRYDDAVDSSMWLEGIAASSSSSFARATYSNSGVHEGQVIAKLSPDGDVLWARELVLDELDTISDICADNAGKVYLTGQAGHYNNGLIAMMDEDGWLRWASTCELSRNANTGKVAVSDAGVFVLGYSDPAFGLDDEWKDIALLKYTTDGVVKWKNIFGGSYAEDYYHRALAAGPLGQVYIAGESFNFLGSWCSVSPHQTQLEGSLEEHAITSSGIPYSEMYDVVGSEGHPYAVLDYGGGGEDALVISVSTQ